MLAHSPFYNIGEYMNKYQKLLQDPRWIKKRKKIKKRDMYRCQSCYKEDVQLEVHHNFYLPNTDPWDYDDTDLITLCHNCHTEVTESKKMIKHKIDNLHPGGLSPLVDLFTSSYDEYRMEEGEGLFSYAEYFRWLINVNTPLAIARFIRKHKGN